MALIYSGNGTLTVNGVLPIAQGGTGQTTAQDAINALLPDQTGLATFVLSTDGSNLLWIQQGAGGSGLPDQTGNAGKYLSTDGFTAYWATVSGGGGGAPAGVSGQLQYNDNDILRGTARISYNDTDTLTVGRGTTETFTIQGATARDSTEGGTSVVISGGDMTVVPANQQIPGAGSVFIQAGGGGSTNTGAPGYISFFTGQNPSEKFRITANGSWRFITSNQGDIGDYLSSNGPSDPPSWEPLPLGSTSTYGLIRINPTSSGLYLQEISGEPGEFGLTAVLTDVDGTSITKNGSGVISVSTTGIFPSQSGQNGKYLTTNGSVPSWGNPVPSYAGKSGQYLSTDGIVLQWASITVANATTSVLGVVRLDGTTITANSTTHIQANIGAMLPDQTGNSGKFLKSNGPGQELSWATGNYTLPIAGTSISPPALGGVIIDNDTINISSEGVISVNSVRAVPPISVSDEGKYLYTNGLTSQWQTFTLTKATTSTLGGVKVPSGATPSITINNDGVISASITNMLPSQSSNTGLYLRTNGSALVWSNPQLTPTPASTTQLGSILTDGITNNTDINGVLTIYSVNLGLTDQNSLVFNNNSGYSDLAAELKYLNTQSTFQIGEQLTSDFTMRSLRNLNIVSNAAGYDNDSSTRWAAGNINIVAGNAVTDYGKGGNVVIQAGDGAPRPPATAADPQASGDVYIKAGAGGGPPFGQQNANPGGSIYFQTNETGPVTTQLRIDPSGAFALTGSPNGGYGYAGTTLITPGADPGESQSSPVIPVGVPYWGVLGIAGGGTGANTRSQSINNLLPTQSGQTGKILASNGTDAYWWEGIPPQTGNNGNFLQTNGTNTQWVDFPYDVVYPPQTGNTGNILSTDGTNVLWIAPEIPSPIGDPNRVLITDGTQSIWTTLTANTLIVPIATTSNVGGFKLGTGNTGYTLLPGAIFSLNTANTTSPGIITVGSGLSVDGTGTVSIGVNGVVPVANGGTGATDGANALINLVGALTSDTVLRSNGSTISLSKVNVLTDVTGVLSTTNGGTGGSINNLLPAQSGNANKFLQTDGNGVLYWSATPPTPAGSSGQFQYNNGGVLAGSPRFRFTSNNTITVGTASTNIPPSDGIFNIIGASSNGANYTPSSIYISPGIQILGAQSPADLTLRGGGATGLNSDAGDVFIDGGIAQNGGTGGSVFIRTTGAAGSGDATTLSQRLAIAPGGAWAVNQEYGIAGQVLQSTGPDSPPVWVTPEVSGSGITGTTLPSNVIYSSLIRVGELEDLTVQGPVGIGTDSPQAKLSVSLGSTATGIEFSPSSSVSTISVINRTGDLYKPLAINSQTISLKTGTTTSVTDRLSIDSNGTWYVNGVSGSNNQVLTSRGAGALPVWANAQGITSLDVSGGSTGLTTSGGPITSSGTITLAGTLNVASGGTGANTGIAASQNVSNFGQLRTFSSVTDFNAVQEWGSTYIADNVNGPGFPTTLGQYYTMMLSVGSDYSWGSGNVYAAQLAFPRNQTSPYLGVRFKEGGNNTSGWGSWQKFSVGFSDSSETANTANFATLAGNVTGVVAIANGGTGQTTATAAINALLPSQTSNANKALVTNGTNVSWRSTTPSYQYISATANQFVVNTQVNTIANNSGVAYIQVFRNGVLQLEGPSKSYTVTGANQLTFNFALADGDDITIFSFV